MLGLLGKLLRINHTMQVASSVQYYHGHNLWASAGFCGSITHLKGFSVMSKPNNLL